MDSFELNKILGALLGTCLVLLSVNFSANAIFSPVKPEKPVKPGTDPVKPVKPGGEKPNVEKPVKPAKP